MRSLVILFSNIFISFLILIFQPVVSMSQPPAVRGVSLQSQTWRIGDEVEGRWRGNFYHGSIIDSDAGRLRVFYTELNFSEWLTPASIRSCTKWGAGDKVEVFTAGGWQQVEILETLGEKYRVSAPGYNSSSRGAETWIGATRVRPVERKAARLR